VVTRAAGRMLWSQIQRDLRLSVACKMHGREKRSTAFSDVGCLPWPRLPPGAGSVLAKRSALSDDLPHACGYARRRSPRTERSALFVSLATQRPDDFPGHSHSQGGGGIPQTATPRPRAASRARAGTSKTPALGKGGGAVFFFFLGRLLAGRIRRCFWRRRRLV
jgi:hypothetical protein